MRTSTAIVAAVTVLGTLATLAYLLARGGDVAPVLAVVTPVLSALFVAGKVDASANVVQAIHHNTNGVLDSRIRGAVDSAMSRYVAHVLPSAVHSAVAAYGKPEAGGAEDGRDRP